jgi:hypothetical protein
MFRGELLVFLEGLDFEHPDQRIKVQMLVDQSEVEGVRGEPKRSSPASAWVRVTLLKEHDGIAEVILPQPAQPVGEKLLVDSREIREATGQSDDPLRS